MRQAISTHYVGPTNFRGGRIIAVAGGGRRLTLPWAYELGIEGNHKRAALQLAENLDWTGNGEKWVGGGTKDGFCFVDATGDA